MVVVVVVLRLVAADCATSTWTSSWLRSLARSKPSSTGWASIKNFLQQATEDSDLALHAARREGIPVGWIASVMRSSEVVKRARPPGQETVSIFVELPSDSIGDEVTVCYLSFMVQSHLFAFGHAVQDVEERHRRDAPRDEGGKRRAGRVASMQHL